MSILKTVADHKKQLKSITTKLSVASIPENALLHGVVKLLGGREMFADTDDELNENMYAGHVFEDILGEEIEKEKMGIKVDKKVLLQLEALAEFVSQDYVLITQI